MSDIDKNLEQLINQRTKKKDIQDKINLLIRPIEEDLYFSVINMTNKMIDVRHIINGISFELIAPDRTTYGFSFSFNENYDDFYIIDITRNGGYNERKGVQTKKELFDYFYDFLKNNELNKQLRTLKIKNLINETED